MANAASLGNAIIAVIPAAAMFFLAYGRYDRLFRDNVVFLFFMGGLFLGAFLGVVTLFALGVAATLLVVLILALFYPIALVAGINRRRWQGERHSVFNGGALGLGVSVMLGFTLLFRLHTEWSPLAVARAVALAVGLSGLFFGMGLLAGDGVRRRAPLRVAFLGTAILFAPVVFLEEYARTRTLLWALLLAAYGLIFAVAAERRLLVEGLEPEARKLLRRRRRKAA